MLREDTGGEWVMGLLRCRFVSGARSFTPHWRRTYRTIVAAQASAPVAIARDGRRAWWMFQDRFYWEDDELEADEVMALLLERDRRKRRRIERAKDLMLAEEAVGPRREPIPDEVKREVYRADGGRCVNCGSAELLQFDHIIPVTMGGASTVITAKTPATVNIPSTCFLSAFI